MKKVLAVFLAILMAFSVGTASFAYGTLGEVPANPEAIEGKVNFVAESTFIEAGQTYEIPVSVVSNYTTTVENGKLVMSFSAVKSGDAPVEITGVKFSDAVKALPGFKAGACSYDGLGDGNVYCSFIVDDLSLLKQANFVVAYITVDVDETFAGEASEATIELHGASLSMNSPDIFPEYALEDFSMYIDAETGDSFVSILDADENVTALKYLGDTDADVYFTSAHLWQEPERPTAKDLLIVQLKRLGLQIVNFLQIILDLVAGFLAPPVVVE